MCGCENLAVGVFHVGNFGLNYMIKFWLKLENTLPILIGIFQLRVELSLWGAYLFGCWTKTIGFCSKAAQSFQSLNECWSSLNSTRFNFRSLCFLANSFWSRLRRYTSWKLFQISDCILIARSTSWLKVEILLNFK